MISEILILIIGFFFLIKGADIFVGASVQIAKRLGIPSIIIGLTIVSLGTSAPEFVVSVTSSLQGANEMAVGNVIGSNIFNLLFILGICSLIKPIRVKFKEVGKDFWISVGAASLLLALKLIFVDYVPQFGAILLLLGFVIYMTILIKSALNKKTAVLDIEISDEQPNPMGRSILLALFGCAAIIIGGQLTVDNAVLIASTLGMSERVIGLTVLAIGTSLPELITTFVALKKGETGVGLGNIIGSNILNILLILGISGTITPLVVDSNLMIDVLVFIVASLMVMFLAYTRKKIDRFEGLMMFSLYVIYMLYTVLAV